MEHVSGHIVTSVAARARSFDSGDSAQEVIKRLHGIREAAPAESAGAVLRPVGERRVMTVALLLTTHLSCAAEAPLKPSPVHFLM